MFRKSLGRASLNWFGSESAGRTRWPQRPIVLGERRNRVPMARRAIAADFGDLFVWYVPAQLLLVRADSTVPFVWAPVATRLLFATALAPAAKHFTNQSRQKVLKPYRPRCSNRWTSACVTHRWNTNPRSMVATFNLGVSPCSINEWRKMSEYLTLLSVMTWLRLIRAKS